MTRSEFDEKVKKTRFLDRLFRAHERTRTAQGFMKRARLIIQLCFVDEALFNALCDDEIDEM